MTQEQLKFKTITSYTMSLKRTGIILIFILTGQKEKISRVLYIFDYTSSLLSLSQLKKTEISYYN